MPTVPQRLADFEVLRLLGTGGMAEVFLAKKRGAEGTYKLLVLKRILPEHVSSRRFRAMFAEEARLATRLNHPNIVQVYDFQDYGEEGQLLSMEYVEGPDLRRLLKAAQARGQRLPPYLAAYIIGEVAKGLHYAHERKDESGEPLDIVHRDISPQNILVSLDGGVKVADFGIASANLFREEPGVLKGKTAFMSPEQARGEKVDRRTDIYSLGVVFHEMLTGQSLHGRAENEELLALVRAGRIEPPSTFARDVPPDLESIVMQALARSPEERFHTAREFAAAITQALFATQKLIDAHELESAIAELITRDSLLKETHAARAAAKPDTSSAARGSSSGGTRPGSEAETGGDSVRYRSGPAREVRHVAVAVLRLHGLEELEIALGATGAARLSEQLRATLGEIAYKRGARWSWDPGNVPASKSTAPLAGFARAAVGLMANPARAAADAASMAIDVHDAIAGACDGLPVTLQASVAIVRGIASGHRDSAGHLVRHHLEEPAPYLAELLGRRAPAGASWVAGGLYRLVRRDFLWGDAPTVEIPASAPKPLPQAMRVYALLRPLSRAEKLKEMAIAPSDLVGRDAEIADLHSEYYAAVGQGRAKAQTSARVLFGEMGIGKTALASTFLTDLPPNARVLRIECSPAPSEVPYATISEIVREFTGARAEQPLDEVTQLVTEALGEFASDRSGGEIIARMAELATGKFASSLESDAARFQRLIASGVRRFFTRAAIDAPLVVVLDGLQWADAPSLKLVADLVRRKAPLPILAILLSRPDERVARLTEGLVHVDLKELSTESQVRLLQARLGVHRGVAAVCADLLPRAAGNPFFLIEMVDALLERGVLEIVEHAGGEHELVRRETQGEGDEDPILDLPSTLEQLIAGRLNELPPEERAVLEWLAVAGGPLLESDLDALSGGTVDEALTRLCARGLCDYKGGRVNVRHPLTRDVAYLALAQRARESMHRDLGTQLARTPVAQGLTAAVVARHFARGKDRPRAAEFYLVAARAAELSYQLDVAARCYRQALSLLPKTDLRRLEVHDALESIYRTQGRWRERRKHLAELRSLAKVAKRPYWVALALFRSAHAAFDRGQFSAALKAAQQAELVATRAELVVIAVQTQVLMGEILRDLGDMQGALAAVERAMKLSSNEGVSALLRADLLRTRGTMLRRLGRVHESVDCYVEIIAVYRQLGARRNEARAKNALAFAMVVLGRYEDGIALAMEAIRIDLSIGGRFQIAKTLANIGFCYAGLGDPERARAYLKRAREVHERYTDRDSHADTLLGTAEVLVDQGDYEAAESLIGDAGALIQVTRSAYDSAHEQILRALLARAAGNPRAAILHASRARETAEAQSYVAYQYYAAAIEAAARVDAGDTEIGARLAASTFSALENLQGSEYGIQTRALACEALHAAGSPLASDLSERSARYLRTVLRSIREARAREMFLARPMVSQFLGEGATGAKLLAAQARARSAPLKGGA